MVAAVVVIEVAAAVLTEGTVNATTGLRLVTWPQAKGAVPPNTPAT
jgi:hypothetical protein